jgi:hypothetical protein
MVVIFSKNLELRERRRGQVLPETAVQTSLLDI